MPAKKTAKTARAKTARAKVHAEPAALARLPKPLKDKLADAREKSHEFALAGLGMFAVLQKQRDARMAEMIAEGRRVEPKVKKAVEEWKEQLQSRIDVKKLKLPKVKFDAAAIRERIEEFRANSKRRFGAAAR